MSVLENDLDPNVFIGVSLPLGLSDDGFFKKTRKTVDQVKSNIRNLLLTQKGERLGNPTFGSNLRRVLFEPNTEDIEPAVESAVREAIDEWLPVVSLASFIFERPINSNTIIMSITFNLDIDQTVATMDLDLGELAPVSEGTAVLGEY